MTESYCQLLPASNSKHHRYYRLKQLLHNIRNRELRQDQRKRRCDIQKKRLIDYIFNLAIKKCFMDGQNNQNALFSFVVLPTPIQYFAFLPITPTTPEILNSSTTPTAYASFSFTSPQIHELYCSQDPTNYLPHSTTSIGEARLPDNPSLNSIQSDLPNINDPFVHNLSSRNISYSVESNFHQENLPIQSGQVSSRNKKQGNKQSGSRKKDAEQSDKQYVPHADRRRREHVRYYENQNRNVIPNQINQILSFIQKPLKSGYLLEKLFKHYPHPSGYSPKRFYLYQSILKGQLTHCTNERNLKLVTELYEPKCMIWSEQEQRYYNKLCRILIRHFLYEDSIFIILTSKRMRSQKKLDHLRARRSVTKGVLQILRGF